MSSHEAWIPLSDPERLFEVTNGAVVNHLALPVGMDTERILLHGGRIERLGRFAGAKQVHLQLLTRSAASEFDHFDVNMTEGGVAVANGLHQKDKKPKADIAFDDTDHPLSSWKRYVKSDGTSRFEERIASIYKADSVGLYLPRKAVEDRVRDDRRNQKGMLDEASWSRVLNGEIKDATVTAATVRYLSSDKYDNFFDPLTDLMVKGWVVHELMEGQYVFPAIVLTISNLRRAAQLYRVTSKQAALRDFNPSIFNDLRIDRIVATAVAAKMGKVVKLAK